MRVFVRGTAALLFAATALGATATAPQVAATPAPNGPVDANGQHSEASAEQQPAEDPVEEEAAVVPGEADEG